MIRALWFMVKVGLLVAIALWIAERPGFVEMTWLDYTLRMHVGMFMLSLLILILISIFLYNTIRTFVDFPTSYKRYLEIKQREKGYRALTLGLTAVAAGDTKNAVYQAQRANRLLQDDNGLPLLLDAQAARLDGREEDAQKSFVALLENKDAAFLGVRGLLQTALDANDHKAALELARNALGLHPKQPWILSIVYDLEIKQRMWGEAEKTLYRAQKAGALDKEKALSDRIAILHAEAEEFLQSNNRKDAVKKIQKAYKYNPDFAPTVMRLARLYQQSGKRRKAANLIQKAWKTNTHPEFVPIWDSLMTTAKGKKPLGRMHWYEKLLAVKADTAEAQIAAGRIAMQEGLWGEARTHLKKAESIEGSAALYRLLAQLEEKASENEEAALLWLEKASDAPQDHVWKCMESGRIYDQWHPIAQPHGSFNTIEWAVPQGPVVMTASLAQSQMADAVLEAPKTGS